MNILKKLTQPHIWERIVFERLTEPLHLNVLSLAVWAFGSFRARVKWDLVVRQHNAYSILKAAEAAQGLGLKKVSIVEFGVATGSGLMNMAAIARQATEATGVEIEIHGFDTGKGMPPARDYRDHPDMYGEGDFAMDSERLRRKLPSNVHLHLGEINDTVDAFLQKLPKDAPIGYVVIDVDYYYSTVDALRIFSGDPEQYLPLTIVYLDDIWCEPHNNSCGELLAVNEWNTACPRRLIERHSFFEQNRIFRRSRWLKQIFFCHVLDHPRRSVVQSASEQRVLENVDL